MNRTAGHCGRRFGPPPRGFTLAELVVALVVVGLVLVSVTASVSRIGASRDLARVRLAAHQRAIDALEALRRDIASAIRSNDLFDCRVLVSSSVIRTRVGELDRSELLLLATRLDPIREIRYNGEGVEYEVQYRIIDDADGSALWRRRDPVPDEHLDAGGVAEPVADNIVSLFVEAYDGEGWRTEWDSDDEGLPLALRVTIVASGAGRGEDPLARPESLVAMRTVVPIDRVPAPRDEEAEAAARQQAAEEAAAAAGADPSLIGVGAQGPADATAVPVPPGQGGAIEGGGVRRPGDGMRGGGRAGGQGLGTTGGAAGAGGGGRGGAVGGGRGGGGGGGRGGGGAGGMGAR